MTKIMKLINYKIIKPRRQKKKQKNGKIFKQKKINWKTQKVQQTQRMKNVII